MKRLLRWTVIALSLLLVVMLLNAWRISAPTFAVRPYRPALDADVLAQRLAAALAIPTLSATAEAPSLARFDELHALLQQQFPRVHASLEREIMSHASLLYRWRGRSDCPATLLAAHQDVVPVALKRYGRIQHLPASSPMALFGGAVPSTTNRH